MISDRPLRKARTIAETTHQRRERGLAEELGNSSFAKQLPSLLEAGATATRVAASTRGELSHVPALPFG
jgi:hypothetical protein